MTNLGYFLSDDAIQRINPAAAPIMRFFVTEHLPPHLQIVSEPFRALAHMLVADIPPSAELTAGLRKLLEAKDCAVRAALGPPGQQG